MILNVRNFFEEVQVLLGGDLDADFQIPKGLYGADGAVLAFKQGQDWKLKLSPEMKGVLYTGGRLVPIPDFVIVNEERDAAVVSLGDGDFVKLQIGALSFHLSRTVSPPVLVKRGEVGSDPFLVRMLLVSLSITILSLFAVSRLEVPQSEPPVFSETVATILYHPEKYTSRPAVPEQQTPLENPVEAVPAKENKVVQSEAAAKTKKKASEGMAKEGAGARALGREGQRGSKTAPKADQGKTAAKRTSPVPGKDRGGTNSRSQDEGNVQLLKGASNRILDLLGGSGQKLGASGSKLEGFGGFSNRGNGGAALQGSGKGGGGRADTLLGGQGNQGRAGGRVGTGLGAEGTGTGIVGGKTLNLNVGGQ
ncbi:MAG: hypothetical protein EBX52_09985 [Proteobacteria bacterium]|nr:hypothetical protein [Pseudomonadota bacterium]